MTADQAPAPSEATCSSCGQAITDAYYEVNGDVTCEDCRIVAEEQFNLGAGIASLLRATGLGLLAAAAGFGIYYGIARWTGSEYGIVAALIGLMVGVAVKRGSHNRGGWRYQTLAMFLTYTAVVASYVPFLYEELMQVAPSQPAAHVAVPSDTVTARPDTIAAPLDTAAVQADTVRLAAVPAEPVAGANGPGMGAMIVGVLALVAFIYAVPFLSGLENLVGLVIIGIALFEAWHLNRRGTLDITGPHELAAPA